jgi:phage terminase large subunit
MGSASMMRKLDVLEPLIHASSGTLQPTVYGVIDRVDNIDGELVPNIIRRWVGTIGNMVPTDEEPTVLLVPKLEPLILKHKKYKCLFGGRGGMKTRFAQNVMVSDVHSSGSKVYALRERMTALRESIFAGIESTISKSGLAGFRSVESKWVIKNTNTGKIAFGGMKNVIDMKGTSEFKYFLMEESEDTKQKTIDILGPTLRDMAGAELWYLWNTGSSQDPMSKEFIIPYQAELDRDGFYEDKYHYIVKLTYEDNPWFVHDESLQQELEKDQSKVKRGIMTQARFNGMWKGAFNDDVASSVIKEDWFNACIDAHKKLNIEPKGAIIAACDPSDTGNDPCGYVARQGIVFFNVKEIEAENGNRKMDEACKTAILDGCDSFGYDADGLGATLRDNVDKSFTGKNTHIFAYKGSHAINDPEAEFKSETANLTNRDPQKKLKNKDVLFNKKAQNTLSFSERVFRTWEAVVEGKMHDPDTLISFASYDPETKQGIMPNMMEKIKAESSKVPIKPADTVKFYTKPELRKGVALPDGSRLVIPSPNLFDAAVLSFDKSSIMTHIEEIDISKINTRSSRRW